MINSHLFSNDGISNSFRQFHLIQSIQMYIKIFLILDTMYRLCLDPVFLNRLFLFDLFQITFIVSKNYSFNLYNFQQMLNILLLHCLLFIMRTKCFQGTMNFTTINLLQKVLKFTSCRIHIIYNVLKFCGEK